MGVVTSSGTPGGQATGDPLGKQPGVQSGPVRLSGEGSTSELLIPARPLAQQFGTLQTPWLKHFYGSEDTNRYCPFVQEVVNDWIPDLPDNALVVDCAMVNSRPERVRPSGHTDSNDGETWMIKNTF
ncbi:hypothetical protein Tcan_06491 [Toxocara canis]|uniref:Uncharacterized protein n=1 Tax=Toxocara canis TaxID=6265 RepID=A0A0B2VFU5_TOXCA|nr:hypothetical protein Tcan_06491 [Toxocara canis]